MPNTSQLSNYLEAQHCKDGDKITFKDAGVIAEKEFTNNGETKKVLMLEITIEINGERKAYSPNKTTIKGLNKAWGTDTEGWIGRQAVIMLVPTSSGKDMILAKAC